MLIFIIIHNHKEGTEDWQSILAASMGINYEPWKSESLEVINPTQIQGIAISKEDWDRNSEIQDEQNSKSF